MFVSSVARFAPIARNVAFRGSRTYLRTMSSGVDMSQGHSLPAWNTNSALSVPTLRVKLAVPVTEDIKSAARFAAARAAVIGSCSYCIIDDY